MNIACIGGGPASLYFAILIKRARPEAEVTVYERDRRDTTWGFGVVFSDATMANFAAADPQSYRAIVERFSHWNDIAIHFKGQVIATTGHGFAGMARITLLEILRRRAEELGVELRFASVIEDYEALAAGHDLVVAADGINSGVRTHWREHFGPSLDPRRNKFIWLATEREFTAFTFFFRANAHGLFRVHAYRFQPGRSTFIVECAEETWKRAGLDQADEAASIAYCEDLFAAELAGRRLIGNNSFWRTFATVRNAQWHHKNVVLAGDAVHTAHFSIGSGTKLAMEDAIALASAVARHGPTRAAFDSYQLERQAPVEALQRAAQASLVWFEEVERLFGSMAPMQFAFSLMTRSLRITHDDLIKRDPEFIARVDDWFAGEAARQAGVPRPGRRTAPLFTPFKLRDLVLKNRVVVSPMCQYRARDGQVGDWHLVHLGSRAVGGAGLVMTEATAVAADARISLGCAGLWNETHAEAWKRIVDFVHAEGGAAVGVQLAHAGRKGATHLPWEERGEEKLTEGAWPLLAPSALPYRPHDIVPTAMNRADMDRVRGEFRDAARLALRAGFDLIEVHFAHGYLLSTFLSPLTNRRDDDYGGSLANRMRFPLEVFDAVRAAWPSERPISARLSATDWVPGGFTPDEAVDLARELKARGCDIVDVSAGQVVPEQRPVYGRLFQTPFAERVRLEADIPTMAVGAITSHADVNSILAAGRADLCCLARAHLYDPYWTRHAAVALNEPPGWPDPYKALDRFIMRFE